MPKRGANETSLNPIFLDLCRCDGGVHRPAIAMIERCNAYKVGDKTFASLAEAQMHELAKLLAPHTADTDAAQTVADALVKQADKVIDILSTGPNSRPKARKANGAVKKRKPKSPFAPAASPM